MKKIKEWIVPDDGRVHEIGGGWILGVHADPYVGDALVVWTEEDTEEPDAERTVKVVEPGELYSEDWRSVGSAAWSGGGIVQSKHLLAERPAERGYIKS